MTATGMARIGKSFQSILKKRRIIARCELLHRSYQFVRDASLSADEVVELQRLVGGQLATGVFKSLLGSEPIFFDLPRLDAFTLLNGRIFHFEHTQKLGRHDFDNALREFQALIPELRVLLLQNLTELLTDFMEDAGYELEDSSSGRLRFEALDRSANCRICTSASSLNLDSLEQEQGVDSIILLPSGENPRPFVQLFREKGGAAEEAGLQIWVANMEQGAIDPFIGYATDLDIYKQFKNPRLAEQVRCTWGAKRSAQEFS